MTNYPYTFHQSPEQRRRIGARGGKAQARNRRQRLLTQAPVLPPMAVFPHPVAETTSEAIAALDAQFPWLRGAEKRRPLRRFGYAIESFKPEGGERTYRINR